MKLISREIDRLVSLGVLSPVQHADWATPIVVVLKKDGSVRICGDFTVTLNPAFEVEHYPLPVIEEMFASLKGGKYFSILDLKDAYNQVPLDEASSGLCHSAGCVSLTRTAGFSGITDFRLE